MRRGYARTSTVDQQAGLIHQRTQLEAAGCEAIYSEHVSALDIDGRVEWARLMQDLRSGDEVVITKIDRVARSIPHMVTIVKAINDAGASMRILDMNIDTSTPAGALMLNLFTSVAQFEVDIQKERQRHAISIIKERDKDKPLEERTYKGRAPTAMRKTESVMLLLAGGKMTKQQVADELGIGVASVYRILKAHKEKHPA